MAEVVAGVQAEAGAEVQAEAVAEVVAEAVAVVVQEVEGHEAVVQGREAEEHRVWEAGGVDSHVGGREGRGTQ